MGFIDNELHNLLIDLFLGGKEERVQAFLFVCTGTANRQVKPPVMRVRLGITVLLLLKAALLAFSALTKSAHLLSFSTRRRRRRFYFLAALRTIFLVSHLQSALLAMRTGIPDFGAAFRTVGSFVLVELGDTP